jgi:hypothetical protein
VERPELLSAITAALERRAAAIADTSLGWGACPAGARALPGDGPGQVGERMVYLEIKQGALNRRDFIVSSPSTTVVVSCLITAPDLNRQEP